MQPIPQIPVTVDYPKTNTREQSAQQGLDGSIMELTFVPEGAAYAALVILSDGSMPTISTDFLKYRPIPQPTPKETTEDVASTNHESNRLSQDTSLRTS